MVKTLLILALLTTTGLAAEATHIMHTMKLGDLSFPSSVTKIGGKNTTARTTSVEDPNSQISTHESGWDIEIAPHITTTFRFTPVTANGEPVTQ